MIRDVNELERDGDRESAISLLGVAYQGNKSLSPTL
jgi:hypothetical protein